MRIVLVLGVLLSACAPQKIKCECIFTPPPAQPVYCIGGSENPFSVSTWPFHTELQVDDTVYHYIP